MKNGKKLTNSQRKVLIKNGVKNTGDYLYVKTETVSQDGNKSLNQKSGKLQRMVFLNTSINKTETYDM